MSESCGGRFRIEVISVGCDPDWGWLTVIFIAVVAVLYMGGGTMYNHHVNGTNGGNALPNNHFWSNMYGLVGDGISFSLASVRTGLAQSGSTAGGGPPGGSGPAGRNSAGALLAEWQSVQTRSPRAARSPLIEAAMLGSKSKVSKLLKRLPPEEQVRLMDQADTRGCTAFHHACGNGHASMAEQLARAGCDTACVDDRGKTGWDSAIETRRDAVLVRLSKLAIDEAAGFVKLRLEWQIKEADRMAADGEVVERARWTVAVDVGEGGE